MFSSWKTAQGDRERRETELSESKALVTARVALLRKLVRTRVAPHTTSQLKNKTLHAYTQDAERADLLRQRRQLVSR